ncbi:response regulator transcription factor [Luteimonas suaedae]|uniref:response regulator transcription factor n=1 Tax=Luteimonas suaedae TaxID=2605430 RepID=UPI001658D1AB|nr:response regulator transcription factor [Luteimonas suaedae]
MPIRVLLVEDDLDIAAGLGDYLAAHGLIVDFAGNATEARARLLDGRFDVLVLDVNLPGEDGVALCRSLKQDQSLRLPVIFLTAHGSLDDKLRGFAAGALDYVLKPFAPAELLARLNAIAVQAGGAGGVCLRVGDYVLDPQRGLLQRGDVHLSLHATGLAILRRLMQAHPGSVGKQALSEGLWGDEPPDSDPLRAHIYQLRQALQARFGEAPIVTVRGVGYRFGAAS